ncbi:M48 family metallopeptidase [Telmatobacter sp. DSM 110680]|uniref:M48 family metallopeptidase n=1 Tax=Telmatobacter sp. DSM 110680 TaxID=3036704 RepID=A0AAU7DKG6_9BACT
MAIVQRLMIAGTVTILFMFSSGSVAGQAPSAPQSQPIPVSSSASSRISSRVEPHSEQAYSLPPDKLAQAVALNKIRVTLDIAGSLWSLLVLFWLLASGTATRLDAWTAERLKRRWVQGLAFFAILIVFLSAAGLPVDAIGHAASLRYGISVQSWASWFGDQGKGMAVSLVMGVPIALFFNWIVRKSPLRYWVWLWVISLPLIVLSVFVAPLIIDPLFNKFEPLGKTHPVLVTRLEALVARTGTSVPPERMFLMKASEKSNGINAYVTGIGSSKRFVMWDTTTDRMPDDEIVFIFGHESGHYVLNHIPKMLAGMMGGLFFVFWGSAKLAQAIVRRFGERWKVVGVGSRAGFLTLFFALSIAGFVLTPVGNTFSRHFEHEADVYGQEAIHGLVADPQKTAVSSFNHLGEAWLDDPNPNAFVEFWSYSHPSVQNRAKFAEQYNPWVNGGHGKFLEK